MINTRGSLLVISGPSGVGKGTVRARVFEMDDTFVYSVSATSRAMREGEVEGKDYFFVTKEKFEQMIANGELLEYTCYNDKYYGTPKAYVEKCLSEGKNVVLEIETEGAFNIRRVCSDALLVFIAPEFKEELYDRLRGRGTNTEEDIENRVKIAEKELRLSPLYDYIVVNRDGMVDECARDILAVARAAKARPAAMTDFVRALTE